MKVIISDESDSRNESSELNSISTFLLRIRSFVFLIIAILAGHVITYNAVSLFSL